MVTRLVPAIYERYWRPALGRVVKGVTGPGMAEEMRIARLLLGLGEGDAVLDVACGPGNFTREFARAVGAHGLAVGIDASPTMLERGAAELRGRTRATWSWSAATPPGCRSATRASTRPAASPPCICSPIRSPPRRDAAGAAPRWSDRVDDLGPPRAGTLRPLKPVIERASGMRVFEGDEIVGALEQRGFTGIHRRLSGMVQFVGARLPGQTDARATIERR